MLTGIVLETAGIFLFSFLILGTQAAKHLCIWFLFDFSSESSRGANPYRIQSLEKKMHHNDVLEVTQPPSSAAAKQQERPRTWGAGFLPDAGTSCWCSQPWPGGRSAPSSLSALDTRPALWVWVSFSRFCLRLSFFFQYQFLEKSMPVPPPAKHRLCGKIWFSSHCCSDPESSFLSKWTSRLFHSIPQPKCDSRNCYSGANDVSLAARFISFLPASGTKYADPCRISEFNAAISSWAVATANNTLLLCSVSERWHGLEDEGHW